jgi:hypothetical protein
MSEQKIPKEATKIQPALRKLATYEYGCEQEFVTPESSRTKNRQTRRMLYRDDSQLSESIIQHHDSPLCQDLFSAKKNVRADLQAQPEWVPMSQSQLTEWEGMPISQSQESVTSVDTTENHPFLLSQESVLTTDATDHDGTENIDPNVGNLKTNNSSFLSQESVLTVDETDGGTNNDTPKIAEHLKTKR